jgi:hypothetical protein
MIFIPHNVPSLKNSKPNGKFHSKTVTSYLRAYGIQRFSSSRKEVVGYKTRPMTFPEQELKQMFQGYACPITVGIHFVRNSKHKFDFINACQIIFDLFTAFDIIPDDNIDVVIPQVLWIDGKHYSYDKLNPGVYISIL